MIIPNLMVAEMARSLAFYRGVLGFTLVTAVSADRQTLSETDGHDAAFAILTAADGQLMLQTRQSLRAEQPSLADHPALTGTIYLRGVDPRPLIAKVPAGRIIKPIERQWYGMLEAYVRDPDGYILCLGVADGPSQA
jgi:catechol 2,3-dioxygenase-like lactoylglutathione lyase family enzyme